MTDGNGTRPEHDPLAEDLDLLTVKEAAARLYDELVAVRDRAAELERSGGDPGELAEARERLANLQDAVRRAAERATPAF